MDNSPFEQPIPVILNPATAGSYHQVPIDLEHALAHETLVNTAAYGIAGESFYARKDGKNAPYNQAIAGAMPNIWCRRTVAEKLVEANALLKPFKLELFVWDAYRPISCQQGLWEYFIKHFRELQSYLSDKEVRELALRYVSDPSAFSEDQPETWPVHSCGGAVDLTMRHLDTKEEVDLGSHFDDMRPVAHTDHFERLLREKRVAADDPRLLNRRLLYWAMTSVGFVNYPYECWHFDWGDQMYIRNGRQLHDNIPTSAWYGTMPAPEAAIAA